MKRKNSPVAQTVSPSLSPPTTHIHRRVPSKSNDSPRKSIHPIVHTSFTAAVINLKVKKVQFPDLSQSSSAKNSSQSIRRSTSPSSVQSVPRVTDAKVKFPSYQLRNDSCDSTIRKVQINKALINDRPSIRLVSQESDKIHPARGSLIKLAPESPSSRSPTGTPRRSYCFEINPNSKMKLSKMLSNEVSQRSFIKYPQSKASSENRNTTPDESEGQVRGGGGSPARLLYSSRLRPMSPIEKTQNKNLLFLTTVTTTQKNYDSSPDDDTLLRLKEIHMQSTKKLESPSVESLKKPSAIEQFRQVYKRILREKERVSLEKSTETPIQAMLFREHSMNVTPMKLGIVQERKDSKIINISHYHLGDRGIDNFCAGLRRLNNYECVNVRENGLSAEGMQNVLMSLKTQIRELDVSANTVSFFNIQLFVEKFNGAPNTLEVIKMEKTQLSDESVDLLCLSLRNVKSIKLINFSSNRITNRSCYAIEDMIKGLPKLEEFFLSSNSIQGEGGTLILDACRESMTVKGLDLSENLLGTASSNNIFNQAFSRFCNKESMLVFLDLSYNKFDEIQSNFIIKAKKADKKNIRFHFQGHDTASYSHPEIPTEFRLIHRHM